MEQHTILIVDDEPYHLESLYRTFRRDYRVLQAQNGEAALALIRSEPVAMILTDQRMPGMTGVELLQKSHEHDPDAIRIILTAYTDVHDLLEAINTGHVYRYVTKPWDPDDLRLVVRLALQTYDLVRENRQLMEELRENNCRLESALSELRDTQNDLIRSERLATVGRMAGAIIHDLKVPLSCVGGYADLLIKEGLTPGQRSEFRDAIKQQVLRFTDMAQEILDYSRGEKRLRLQPVRLADMFIELNRMMRARADSQRVQVAIHNGVEVPLTVDPTRFLRMMFNLCINAIDALESLPEDHDKRLTITASREDGEVQIVMADTAAGIPEDIRDTLFEPFVTHGKSHGTGLGLAIVKKTVEEHDGEIEVRSETGVGTTFTIRLPITGEGTLAAGDGALQ